MSDQNRPLVSTEDDMPENKSGGGCLGRVAQWIGIIVVIASCQTGRLGARFTRKEEEPK